MQHRVSSKPNLIYDLIYDLKYDHKYDIKYDLDYLLVEGSHTKVERDCVSLIRQ
jgi:hypothetical protein